MRIQHNIMALNSQRQLGINNNNISKSLEKLSSGYRINRAGDDAAGLAISEKMRAQIKGLETATDNANDGISLIQTAEGGLQEVHSMLNRMTELATKSSNGTYDNNTDRNALQNEYNALVKEIDRIASTTNFNGIKLLDGSLQNSSQTALAFGAANLTAGAGASYGTGTVQIVGAAGTNTIDVAIGADGKSLKISLGNTAAASYSLKDIEDAVHSKVQSMLDGNAFTDATAAGLAEGLLTFSLTGSNSALTLSAGDTTDTTAKAMVNAATNGVMTLQIGESGGGDNLLYLAISKMDSSSIGKTDAGVFTSIKAAKIDDRAKAEKAVDIIKEAINQVSTQRGELGAVQNRLEHTINNLGVTTENITAAESRIRDVDMAKEMMTFTKNSVLQQSAQAMLAQANQQPQSVLQLLQ